VPGDAAKPTVGFLSLIRQSAARRDRLGYRPTKWVISTARAPRSAGEMGR
jgi:hypothetical protein